MWPSLEASSLITNNNSKKINKQHSKSWDTYSDRRTVVCALYFTVFAHSVTFYISKYWTIESCWVFSHSHSYIGILRNIMSKFLVVPLLALILSRASTDLISVVAEPCSGKLTASQKKKSKAGQFTQPQQFISALHIEGLIVPKPPTHIKAKAIFCW